MGAFHSAEHMYLHMTFLRSWRDYTGEDYEFAKRINAYWTNFIKYGDPNGEGLAKWEPYTENNRKMMHLKGECHESDVMDSERLWFATDYALGNLNNIRIQKIARKNILFLRTRQNRLV